MVEYKNEENFLLKEIEDSDKFCTGCAACDLRNKHSGV